MSRQIQWLAPNGTTLTLTDPGSGYKILADATTGLDAPPYRFVTQQYAGLDGITVLDVTANSREVVLGMLINAPDPATLKARCRALVHAMRPKLGPGQLAVTDDDGTLRTLTCWYASGLEGVEARASKLPGQWWKVAVHFLADDPWWYGPQQTLQAGLGAPTAFFPIFPLVLSPSTIQGSFTVDLSDSDDGAYPAWTITGPGTELVLTNSTTGRSLTVNTTLTGTDTLVIDTRPNLQSVRKGDGTNVLGSVVGYPDLWPLEPAVNDISAVLTGATSASRISAVYSARYAGA